MSTRLRENNSDPAYRGSETLLNVLVWAHSDQAGGAELASVIARAFVEGGLPLETVGIVCPGPRIETVLNFFRHEPIQIRRENIIESDESLRIDKGTNGRVDAEATYSLLAREPFASAEQLEDLIKRQAEKVKSRIHSHSLVISCGEPIAVKVARDLGLKCVIITDHLLTATVRWVLQHGGLFDRKMAELLTRFEDWDRMADEAFLSPSEFGGTDYDTYLAHGSMHCNYLGGLFYEPLTEVVLRLNPSYNKLKDASRGQRIVFVFGGGGPVWLGVYKQLHDEIRRKGVDRYALLLPALLENSPQVTRKKDEREENLYTLYTSGSDSIELEDPGRLMYWYAACDLFVGRGGLAAQQICATMMSDVDNSPEMLFVEEPGHPQIEHERQSLYKLGFVQTRTLDAFLNDPMEVINDVLDSIRQNETRFRVRSRYGAKMLNNVAEALLHSFVPVPRS